MAIVKMRYGLNSSVIFFLMLLSIVFVNISSPNMHIMLGIEAGDTSSLKA